MAESFASKFKPMSLDKPKCLFPLANIPIILFALEFLATNNVKTVFLVSSRETKVFSSIIKTIKETHKSLTTKFEIKLVKLDNPTSLAMALKDLNEMADVELQDNFILI